MNQAESRRQSRIELVENVEFLLSNGIRGDALVAQLGTTQGALNQRLYRIGRKDLARAVGCPRRLYKPRLKKE
jgi:hypothetical protein